MKILVLMVVLFLISSCTNTFLPSEEIASSAISPAAIESADTQPGIESAAKPQLIQGKTVEKRIEEAYNLLHYPESGQHVREHFPDLRRVYSDPGEAGFPREILPFEYYYSPEANKTFNICALDFTVFICNGELSRKITEADENSGRCVVTAIYRETKENTYD